MGIHLSDNPFEPYRHIYQRNDITMLRKMLSDEMDDGAEAWVFAQLDNYKTVKTKAGSEMGYLSLSDISGTMEGILFPKIYARFRSGLSKNSMVFIRGKLQKDETRGTKLLIDEIRYPSEKELKEKTRRLYLKLSSKDSEEYKQVIEILLAHSGVYECILYFADTHKSVSTLNRFGIDINDQLLKSLKNVLNESNIVIK